MAVPWTLLCILGLIRSTFSSCSLTSYYRSCWIRRFPGVCVEPEECVRKGASLLRVYREESAVQCSRACCLTPNFSCSLAVFHFNTTQESVNCFHLQCPTLESCTPHRRGNVILYNVTKGVDPDLLVFGKYFTTNVRVLPHMSSTRLNTSEPLTSDKRQFNYPPNPPVWPISLDSSTKKHTTPLQTMRPAPGASTEHQNLPSWTSTSATAENTSEPTLKTTTTATPQWVPTNPGHTKETDSTVNTLNENPLLVHSTTSSTLDYFDSIPVKGTQQPLGLQTSALSSGSQNTMHFFNRTFSKTHQPLSPNKNEASPPSNSASTLADNQQKEHTATVVSKKTIPPDNGALQNSTKHLTEKATTTQTTHSAMSTLKTNFIHNSQQVITMQQLASSNTHTSSNGTSTQTKKSLSHSETDSTSKIATTPQLPYANSPLHSSNQMMPEYINLKGTTERSSKDFMSTTPQFKRTKLQLATTKPQTFPEEPLQISTQVNSGFMALDITLEDVSTTSHSKMDSSVSSPRTIAPSQREFKKTFTSASLSGYETIHFTSIKMPQENMSTTPKFNTFQQSTATKQSAPIKAETSTNVPLKSFTQKTSDYFSVRVTTAQRTFEDMPQTVTDSTLSSPQVPTIKQWVSTKPLASRSVPLQSSTRTTTEFGTKEFTSRQSGPENVRSTAPQVREVSLYSFQQTTASTKSAPTKTPTSASLPLISSTQKTSENSTAHVTTAQRKSEDTPQIVTDSTLSFTQAPTIQQWVSTKPLASRSVPLQSSTRTIAEYGTKEFTSKQSAPEYVMSTAPQLREASLHNLSKTASTESAPTKTPTSVNLPLKSSTKKTSDYSTVFVKKLQGLSEHMSTMPQLTTDSTLSSQSATTIQQLISNKSIVSKSVPSFFFSLHSFQQTTATTQLAPTSAKMPLKSSTQKTSAYSTVLVTSSQRLSSVLPFRTESTLSSQSAITIHQLPSTKPLASASIPLHTSSKITSGFATFTMMKEHLTTTQFIKESSLHSKETTIGKRQSSETIPSSIVPHTSTQMPVFMKTRSTPEESPSQFKIDPAHQSLQPTVQQLPSTKPRTSTNVPLLPSIRSTLQTETESTTLGSLTYHDSAGFSLHTSSQTTSSKSTAKVIPEQQISEHVLPTLLQFHLDSPLTSQQTSKQSTTTIRSTNIPLQTSSQSTLSYESTSGHLKTKPQSHLKETTKMDNKPLNAPTTSSPTIKTDDFTTHRYLTNTRLGNTATSGGLSSSLTAPTNNRVNTQPYLNDTKGYISRNVTTGEVPRPVGNGSLTSLWHLAANTVLVVLATCATITFGCCCSVFLALSWRGRRRRKGRYRTHLRGKRGSMKLIKYVIVRESS